MEDNRLFTRQDLGEDTFKPIQAGDFLAAVMARANKVKVNEMKKRAIEGTAADLEYFRSMKEDYTTHYREYWEEWKTGTGQMITWLANRKEVANRQQEMLTGIKQSLEAATTENEELKAYISLALEELDKLISDCATWDDHVTEEIDTYTKNLAEWTAEDWLKYTTQAIDARVKEITKRQNQQNEMAETSDKQDKALAEEAEKLFGCEDFLTKMLNPKLD